MLTLSWANVWYYPVPSSCHWLHGDLGLSRSRPEWSRPFSVNSASDFGLCGSNLGLSFYSQWSWPVQGMMLTNIVKWCDGTACVSCCKSMQCNKEAVTISLDIVLISCLLINPQVLSLNVLNLQCNTTFVMIRRDLILISCLFMIHQVLSIEPVWMDYVFIVFF